MEILSIGLRIFAAYAAYISFWLFVKSGRIHSGYLLTTIAMVLIAFGLAGAPCR